MVLAGNASQAEATFVTCVAHSQPFWTGYLGDIHDEHNLDGVNFNAMRQWIMEADSRGGVNTLSTHLDNPVTGRNAWDKTDAVNARRP